jgi:sortase A
VPGRLAYHGSMDERTTRQRLTRRAANLLLVVGGLVLAFPFWSSASTRSQQGDLESSYRSSEAAFALAQRSHAAVIDRLPTPEGRLRYVAGLYARDTRAGRSLGRLKIPRLHLDRIVIEGTGGAGGLSPKSDTSLLRKGPVHYGTTALPGAGRPFAVAGHRTTYGAPFYHLNELRRGDEIVVEMPYGRFTYRVDKLTEVSPEDVSVLADRGFDLVLTTCTPLYSAKRRLVVWARLAESMAR